MATTKELVITKMAQKQNTKIIDRVTSVARCKLFHSIKVSFDALHISVTLSHFVVHLVQA
jgi:hypothetical protein